MKYKIIFGIVILIGLLGLGYMHEEAHIQIYESYGIEANIEWIDGFPDLLMVAEKPCPTESCTLANNLNEVVGYHTIVLYCIIALGLFTIVAILEEKKEGE